MDKHLSPEDLAEREGVPLDTVYKWNSSGDGPDYMRIGRHVRYRLADVLAWEKSRLVARERPQVRLGSGPQFPGGRPSGRQRLRIGHASTAITERCVASEG